MRIAFWSTLAVLGVCGVLAAASWTRAERPIPHAASSPLASGQERAPVIVELFSSEGCSSCPPADEYLAELDRAQSVAGVNAIALEQHVDYWDQLGWRDPYGSHETSLRQRVYSTVLPDHRLFTPELVVDGSALISPYDPGQAVRTLQQAAAQPKARVAIHMDGGRAIVDVGALPVLPASEHARLMLALTERGLRTKATSGENAGQQLAHGPIVRRLAPLAVVDSKGAHAETAIELDPSWKPAALRVVAFVQLSASGAIIGADAVPFSKRGS
jgi:hypothetical protein